MRFLSASDQALLVELPDLASTMALHRAVLARPITGIRDMVPAARTLLVHFLPWETNARALEQALLKLGPEVCAAQATPEPLGRLVEIPVHYRGEDLPTVAQLLGMEVRDVIEQHTSTPYDAAFAGFAPGFVYLSGGANFQVPRRKTPRTKVPAGSVALGGNFSAVYPSASPGGWQLIGHTAIAMWDLARAEPAFIQPSFRVQFVDADRPSVQVHLPRAKAEEKKYESKLPSALVQQGLEAIEIIHPGLQTLVQDAGRHGMSGLGISESGVLDQSAMRSANRLVGNPIHTAVLENVLGRLSVRSHGATTLAVTGAFAPMTLETAQGATWPVSCGTALALNDGDRLHLGAVTAGVRCYVAVRGGWSVEPVLGSQSTDTLAQVGPAMLQAGQRIAVGHYVPATALTATGSPLDSGGQALPVSGEDVWMDVVLGPRDDWFTTASLEVLTTQRWRVTPQSNRIGMRLEGAQPLQRKRHDELPSEGTVIGAIQVPASGQPVVFLADHPLTGGYPVIGAIARYHLDRAAQIPVGCYLRFRLVSAEPEAAP